MGRRRVMNHESDIPTVEDVRQEAPRFAVAYSHQDEGIPGDEPRFPRMTKVRDRPRNLAIAWPARDKDCLYAKHV